MSNDEHPLREIESGAQRAVKLAAKLSKQFERKGRLYHPTTAEQPCAFAVDENDSYVTGVFLVTVTYIPFRVI